MNELSSEEDSLILCNYGADHMNDYDEQQLEGH